MNFTSLTLIANTAWTLSEETANKIVLYKDNTNRLTLTSDSAASPYVFNITSDTTDIEFGSYQWQAFLDDVFVDRGTLNILPNLETQDPRGYWTRVYNNLSDAYERLSNKETDEVALSDGTSIKYTERAKLVSMMSHAETKMNEESGRRVSRKILGKFY